MVNREDRSETLACREAVIDFFMVGIGHMEEEREFAQSIFTGAAWSPAHTSPASAYPTKTAS